MKELIEKIEKLLSDLKSGYCSEEVGYMLLTDILYTKYQDDMVPLFLNLRQRELDKERKEKEVLYTGLSESVANISSLLELSEEKSRRKFNDRVNYIKDNEALLIRTAIAYCPNGVIAGRDVGIIFILKIVVNLVLKNKDTYQIGGNNRDFAKRNGYLDWIENVLKIYNDDGTLK